MELLAGERLIWSGHPSWRASLSFLLRGVLAAAVVLVVLVLVDVLGAGHGWTYAGVAAAVAIFAVAVLGTWVLRQFTVYTITNRRLLIRRGILSKTETSTSLDRVQNVTIQQSPIDRLLKTGTIDFDTASDDPSDQFRFIGIDNPQALRHELVEAQQRHGEPGDGLGAPASA